MNLDPGMMDMMKDLDGAEMNKQLESLGLSPSEVINKIMAEPDLAAAFQKPKVMQVSGADTRTRTPSNSLAREWVPPQPWNCREFLLTRHVAAFPCRRPWGASSQSMGMPVSTWKLLCPVCMVLSAGPRTCPSAAAGNHGEPE
jgi:hypothetical protein